MTSGSSSHPTPSLADPRNDVRAMWATRRPPSVILLLAATAMVIPFPVHGAMNASAADMVFAPLTYAHASQTVSGSLTLEATDTGTTTVLGTTNAGWNVTIQASPFVYSGPNSGTPIPAANLAITAAQPPTRVAGQPVSSTGGPRATGVTGSLDVARKTLQADGPTGTLLRTYYGIGTYRQVINVSLVVPGRSRAGTYASTLTVTMAVGP